MQPTQYSWQQQQGEFRNVQQQQDLRNQQWREDRQQYQQQMGSGGYQQADPHNAYQKYLQANGFNSYFDPNQYQNLLNQQRATAGVHQQVSQQFSYAQQQRDTQHQQQYEAELAAFLQQRGQSMDQYRSGQVYVDQHGQPQAVRSVETQHGHVVAPENYQQMLQQSIAAGQVPQFQKPPEIDFRKLNPEEFHEQKLYYRPSCVHCINLLSHLARDPLLDSKMTKINIDQIQVQGLVGVPTIVDERNQVWLGDAALRWVNSQASKDVIGMAVEDVSPLPTSDLVSADPGENFSFVHESLLNMPNVNSLYAIDTRQQRGPMLDQVLNAVQQDRDQVRRPMGDPGNLTPVQYMEPRAPVSRDSYSPANPPLNPYQQQQQFGRPQQANRPMTMPAGPMAPSTAASRLFNRPEMNSSQKHVQNRSYEMDRSAFLGDQSALMARRYQ